MPHERTLLAIRTLPDQNAILTLVATPESGISDHPTRRPVAHLEAQGVGFIPFPFRWRKGRNEPMPRDWVVS